MSASEEDLDRAAFDASLYACTTCAKEKDNKTAAPFCLLDVLTSTSATDCTEFVAKAGAKFPHVPRDAIAAAWDQLRFFHLGVMNASTPASWAMAWANVAPCDIAEDATQPLLQWFRQLKAFDYDTIMFKKWLGVDETNENVEHMVQFVADMAPEVLAAEAWWLSPTRDEGIQQCKAFVAAQTRRGRKFRPVLALQEMVELEARAGFRMPCDARRLLLEVSQDMCGVLVDFLPKSAAGGIPRRLTTAQWKWGHGVLPGTLVNFSEEEADEIDTTLQGSVFFIAGGGDYLTSMRLVHAGPCRGQVWALDFEDPFGFQDKMFIAHLRDKTACLWRGIPDRGLDIMSAAAYDAGLCETE